MASQSVSRRAQVGVFLAMPVGMQREEPVNFSEIYDLTREGEYVVYTRRAVSTWLRSTNVVSGEATFRVVRGDRSEDL